MAEIIKKILWADDEIDLLEAHVLFLGSHGYQVTPVTNGDDALSKVDSDTFRLCAARRTHARTRRTGNGGAHQRQTARSSGDHDHEIGRRDADGRRARSKDRGLLDEARQSDADSGRAEKVIDKNAIEQRIATRDYLQEFRDITMKLMDNPGWQEWADIHARLSWWDIEMDRLPDEGLKQSLEGQRTECNVEFGKFIEKNYEDWLWNQKSDRRCPWMSWRNSSRRDCARAKRCSIW
jgi:CheY-like chemotaxis protein